MLFFQKLSASNLQDNKLGDCYACSEQSVGIFCSSCDDNLLYEIVTLRLQRRIATLPMVARNKRYQTTLEKCQKLTLKIVLEQLMFLTMNED